VGIDMNISASVSLRLGTSLETKIITRTVKINNNALPTGSDVRANGREKNNTHGVLVKSGQSES
jgi:hypothetical protein